MFDRFFNQLQIKSACQTFYNKIQYCNPWNRKLNQTSMTSLDEISLSTKKKCRASICRRQQCPVKFSIIHLLQIVRHQKLYLTFHLFSFFLLLVLPNQNWVGIILKNCNGPNICLSASKDLRQNWHKHYLRMPFERCSRFFCVNNEWQLSRLNANAAMDLSKVSNLDFAIPKIFLGLLISP